ncbi:MAG: hypothetical protein J6P98_06715, partial [Clostridia bacterium]|nr:hypothetical protein [Clostridia bacterium]
METLVELYVNEQFDNLLAPLVFKPKRVVYLCAGFMPDRATRDEVSRSVGSASECCKVRFIDVGNRSLSSLFRKVGEVAREYPDSVIDMTGGPTGLLVAAHRYCVRNKFRSFFFDEKRGRFVNICGCSAELSNVVIPKLTV